MISEGLKTNSTLTTLNLSCDETNKRNRINNRIKEKGN